MEAKKIESNGKIAKRISTHRKPAVLKYKRPVSDEIIDGVTTVAIPVLQVVSVPGQIALGIAACSIIPSSPKDQMPAPQSTAKPEAPASNSSSSPNTISDGIKDPTEPPTISVEPKPDLQVLFLDRHSFDSKEAKINAALRGKANLEDYIYDVNDEVRAAAASNASLSQYAYLRSFKDIELLVKYDVTPVRLAFAKNINLGKEFLEILVKDSDPSVRQAAKNTLEIIAPPYNPSLFNEFSTSYPEKTRDEKIKLALEGYKNSLLFDYDPEVRAAAASKHHTLTHYQYYETSLEIMMKFDVTIVRLAIAKNLNTSTSDLNILKEDTNPKVKAAAILTLRIKTNRQF